MDLGGTFPLDSIVTVHALGKQWSRFGQRVSPYARKQKQRPGYHGEDSSTEDSDPEQLAKDRSSDGLTRDHPEGFEVIV